jgi:DNA polymerase
MPIAPDLSAELQSLLGSARAYLELEQDLGTDGFRDWPREPAVRSRPVAPEPAVVAAVAPRPVASAIRPTHDAVVAPPQPIGDTGPRLRLSLDERRVRLAALAEEAKTCTACVLHEQRKQAVFSRGNLEARLVFVGEGPGRDEDQQGLPFVGAAGQLLDRMVGAMGFARDDVYICNVVKCRPPENRTPRPEEALACKKFLVPQIEAIAPEVIVALGRCAAQALGAAEAQGSWRGRWSTWQGVPVMPTYHPAFLLRSPEVTRTVWEDLQLVMKRLGLEAPKRGA